MGAGLLAITLDLLSPTFIARPSYSPSLLHGPSGGLLRLVGVIIVDWRVLFDKICGVVVNLRGPILTRLGRASGAVVNSV